ncbi:unnamed protein product [Phyllotreta striolata]|uniref:Uncharacterized protein n=1 Tax=Phyllotreta striolata TaxID=444603 RepID=A0A9N9XNP3_PHYSR|nr:unnamed protein product [Phyllotreta striolata]
MYDSTNPGVHVLNRNHLQKEVWAGIFVDTGLTNLVVHESVVAPILKNASRLTLRDAARGATAPQVLPGLLKQLIDEPARFRLYSGRPSLVEPPPEIPIWCPPALPGSGEPALLDGCGRNKCKKKLKKYKRKYKKYKCKYKKYKKKAKKYKCKYKKCKRRCKSKKKKSKCKKKKSKCKKKSKFSKKKKPKCKKKCAKK